MKITLINPPYNFVKVTYGPARKNAKYGYWAPFGIAVLAGVAKKLDCQFEYIDSAVLDYSIQDIVQKIENSRPDIIGLTAQLGNRESAKELIRLLREKINVPIFLGGALGTTFPETVLLENPGLDYAVIGEAEQTLQELILKIKNGQDVKTVRGICYRQGEQIVRTSPRPILMNLDLLPQPDFTVFDLDKYFPLPLQYKHRPIIAYLASRGCSYGQCTFCFESGSAAQKYRRHSVKRVIQDIQLAMETCGVKEICFWDDIFWVDEPWVLEFCELIHQNKIKLTWQCYGYAGSMTKKMVDESAKAGCWNVYIGFESATQSVLDRVKKGVGLDQMVQSIRWVRDSGMDVRGSFILGLPGETPKTAMDSVRFAIENDLTYLLFNTCFPEYGTPLYSDLVREGKIIDEYKGRSTAQYVPEGFKDAAEVESIIRKAYRKFYFRPSYIWKHVKRIHSWEHIKQYYEAMRLIAGIAGI
ncbi:MAG: cobalamin B12-binding domain-containing protein [Elusimicrobia bacterium]|nr:cobalamin B12-binding domain-containing protein [Elusimicrobiota bacterium]